MYELDWEDFVEAPLVDNSAWQEIDTDVVYEDKDD